MYFYRKLSTNIDKSAAIHVTFNDGKSCHLRTLNEIQNALCNNSTASTVNVTFPEGIGQRPRSDVISIEFLEGYNDILTYIPDYFCYRFDNLNCDITIPDSVTDINYYFLFGCKNYDGRLKIGNSVLIIKNAFMSGCRNFTGNGMSLYEFDNIKTIGDSFLQDCQKFNSSLRFQSLTSIGNYAFEQCYALNNDITFSQYNLTKIGTNFMHRCKIFNKVMTFPNSITSIGEKFLTNCYNLRKLNLNFEPTGVLQSNILYDFAVNDSSAPAYINGIELYGRVDTAAKIKEIYPNGNLSSGYYRNLK